MDAGAGPFQRDGETMARYAPNIALDFRNAGNLF
jgi:hypothetical protein